MAAKALSPLNLDALMPLCLVPTCSQTGQHHLLPHQREIATQILDGHENYIYWQGGVGSAKTVLYGALSVYLALLIPGLQGILFRKDFGLNHETLWGAARLALDAARTQGWLGELSDRQYRQCFSVSVAGGHTICKLPNGSVLRAGETKNWSRFMGPTYDLIVVSDAMENHNFGEIFHGVGVVGGLQSRLRGQRSAFYPTGDDNYKDMRRFLIESNPPPRINELHEIFGREPGVRPLTAPDEQGRQITYRHLQTTTVQNDHNPPSYIAEIASQHPNRDDIRRILEGQTVPYYGGIRVIESFHAEVHVAEFRPDPDLPLLVGIDPGYQHPAVVFAQIKRCTFGYEHYMTLSEISNLFNKTTWELLEYEQQDQLGVLPHLGLFYPEFFDLKAYQQVRQHLIKLHGTEEPLPYQILQEHFSKMRFAIDRAGNQMLRTNRQRLSDVGILLTEYGISTRGRSILVQPSLDRLRELHKDVCACGIPRRMIDQKCALLIDALGGGYRFSRKKDGSHSDAPIQDHLYEDIVDADRYTLENFLWVGKPAQEAARGPLKSDEPWAWMERGV